MRACKFVKQNKNVKKFLIIFLFLKYFRKFEVIESFG